MKVTYNNLKSRINNEPVLVTGDGDLVTAITCDNTGVMCEDDYGATDYEYDELSYYHLKD